MFIMLRSVGCYINDCEVSFVLLNLVHLYSYIFCCCELTYFCYVWVFIINGLIKVEKTIFSSILEKLNIQGKHIFRNDNSWYQIFFQNLDSMLKEYGFTTNGQLDLIKYAWYYISWKFTSTGIPSWSITILKHENKYIRKYFNPYY